MNEPSNPFSDSRIALGISLGILVFCMGVVVYSMVFPAETLAVHATEAWSSIRVILVTVLAAGAVVAFKR